MKTYNNGNIEFNYKHFSNHGFTWGYLEESEIKKVFPEFSAEKYDLDEIRIYNKLDEDTFYSELNEHDDFHDDFSDFEEETEYGALAIEFPRFEEFWTDFKGQFLENEDVKVIEIDENCYITIFKKI